VPATPLTGPLPRGHRGHLLGNQPVATLQLADQQGTPPVTWRWNNGWQALPAQPPGTVFASSGALFSPYADDGGFKLATWDGGTWSTFATLSTDTTEFSIGPGSDPIGFGSSSASYPFMVVGRSSTTNTLRAFSFDGTGFFPFAGTVSSNVTEARTFSRENGFAGPLLRLQSGALAFGCTIGCGLFTPVTAAPSSTSFDGVTSPVTPLYVVAAAGQLELRSLDYPSTTNSIRPGPLRAGVPSTTLNNNPLCFADRPELATFDARFVVAWQERCGTGPWKVYLRYAE
jgi:hypothetical protein